MIKAAIYGFAVGDALGVPYEFMKRGTFRCTGMKGGGIHRQTAGTWSDDTSMTLATLDSLKKCGGVDYEDMMENFLAFMLKGSYTAHGEVFDIGNTTQDALWRAIHCQVAIKCGGTGYYDNGNGSLMRILPLAFTEATDEEIENISAMTHGHKVSKRYCVEYVHIARKLIKGASIKEALKGYESVTEREKIDISSNGFVAHTFEAAIWCLANTDSYKDCVLTAVNLGEDTDTVAAIAGGLAGIAYGYEAIPKEWIETLSNKGLIDEIISDF